MGAAERLAFLRAYQPSQELPASVWLFDVECGLHIARHYTGDEDGSIPPACSVRLTCHTSAAQHRPLCWEHRSPLPSLQRLWSRTELPLLHHVTVREHDPRLVEGEIVLCLPICGKSAQRVRADAAVRAGRRENKINASTIACSATCWTGARKRSLKTE